MAPPEVVVMDVEAERVSVKVGNLTVESGPEPGSRVATAFGAKILLDGKEPPIGVYRIELAADLNGDGLWNVALYGYPKGE